MSERMTFEVNGVAIGLRARCVRCGGCLEVHSQRPPHARVGRCEGFVTNESHAGAPMVSEVLARLEAAGQRLRVAAVAKAYGVAIEDLFARSRDRNTSRARQSALLALHRAGLRIAQIARLVGSSDCNVRYAVQAANVRIMLEDDESEAEAS